VRDFKLPLQSTSRWELRSCTQRVVVIVYRRFGTNYRSQLQATNDSLSLQMGSIGCPEMSVRTEVLPCFFLSCKTNARVKPTKTGVQPALFLFFVFFYVLFVSFRSLYCFFVYVYCSTATGWLPNCS